MASTRLSTFTKIIVAITRMQKKQKEEEMAPVTQWRYKERQYQEEIMNHKTTMPKIIIHFINNKNNTAVAVAVAAALVVEGWQQTRVQRQHKTCQQGKDDEEGVEVLSDSPVAAAADIII